MDDKYQNPKGNEEESKPETAVGIVKEWASSTSFHGLPSLAKNDNLFIRVIWVICFCASSGWCMYSVFTSVVKYYEYNVVTQIQTVYENPTDYPVVTICNMNPFLTPDGLAFSQQTLLQNGIDDLANSPVLQAYLKSSFQAVTNTFYAKLLVQANSMTQNDTVKKTFGYPIYFTILTCFFARASCTLANFTWYYSYDYGNCYQFNSGLEEIFTTTHPGAKYGLTVVLFTGYYKSVYSLSFTNGAHIFIHNQTSAPSSTNGLDIAPGTTTNIAVSRTFSRQLPKPYNDCYDDLTTADKFDSFYYRETIKSNFTYRQIDCLNLVEQDIYIKNCSCAEPSYPTLYGTRYCSTIYEILCIDLVNWDIYRKGVNVDWLKYCPLECSSDQYSYTTSFSDFPSRSLADLMLSDANALYFLDSINVSHTYESIQENLAYVNIFYDYTGYTLITESPAEELVDLLSSIGGTMGLYLGISFLSFVEVFELVFMLILQAVHNSRKRKISARATIINVKPAEP